MAVARTKIVLILALALLLPGCASRSLSARELVRAAFFAREGEGYRVALLLADQEAGEGEAGYKTARASGRTPAQALQQAAQSLRGTAFYGLMDVVCLPAETDWELAAEIGALLYERAKPTPELAMYLLPESKIPDDVHTLYEKIQAEEKNHKLHCGLQQIFEQQDFCALPICREHGCGFALLAKGRPPVRLEDPLAAQLAAALCGAGKLLDSPYADGGAWCHAGVRADVEPAAGQTVIRLHLTDVRLEPLSGLFPDETSARTALRAELAETFEALQAAEPALLADLCRLSLWTAVRYGPGALPAAPVLQVCFE